jgi:hypothetical protein
LPVRRNTYVDAAKKVLARREQRRKESLLIAPSDLQPVPTQTTENTTITSSPISNDTDWDTVFEKDLALALQASLNGGQAETQHI